MRVVIPIHPETVRAWADLLARFNEEHHTLFCAALGFVLCSLAFISIQAIKRSMKGD